MTNICILVLCVLGSVAAYTGPDLPEGPFCGKTRECCRDRRDSCAHRILDTLCYCDEFCDFNRAHDDCCPDYLPVCRNQTAEPGLILQPCRHRGQLFLPGQTRADNCNTCECVHDERTKKTEWSCERDACLMSDDVVYGVNQPGLGWRAYNYSQFYGKKLKDGLTYKLGTLPLSPETQRMLPIEYDSDAPLPDSFDARQRWPGYITPIVDQGWCGSDWAVSIASIASDRFGIMSNGAESLVLSPQTLLSCNRRHQRGCGGGNIDVAWNFAGEHGLVEEKCFPYTAKTERCPYQPHGDLIQDGCRPKDPRRTSRYKVGPPYRLVKEEDIMYDIRESGPVQAVMTVYQDFFHYRDGIYRRSRHGDSKLQGLHSVRIVGWGEDRQEKFWIVANSWGTDWGENGYFRIARGSNESGIESFVVSAFSDVTSAFLRPSVRRTT
ncbi:tubulointerstitial nephritis antigen [Cydia fagiglandana]|uniref:tubulointerstitial nephritis antigen n=1 Tax=Cydia fagiglandana TaxID=1458189 RepID=UPI002FEE34C9